MMSGVRVKSIQWLYWQGMLVLACSEMSTAKGKADKVWVLYSYPQIRNSSSSLKGHRSLAVEVEIRQ